MIADLDYVADVLYSRVAVGQAAVPAAAV
jgi:hypothetical protein